MRPALTRPAVAALVAAALASPSAGAAHASDAGAPDDTAVLCSDAGTALALGPRGQVLVGGSTFTNEIVEEPSGDHGHIGDLSVLRYTPRGDLDRSFGDGGHADVDVGDFDDLADLEIDGRGRVFGAGSSRNVVDGGLGPFDISVWRHRRHGGLASSFGNDGTALIDLGGSEHAEAAALDRRGRLLVAGSTEIAGVSKALVLRLDPDGELDPSFGEGGWRAFGDLAVFNGVHVDRTGRITLSGSAEQDGSAATAIARLDDLGHPIESFGDAGTTLFAWPGLQADDGALALDRNGRILTATALTDGTAGSIGIVRLGRTGRPDPSWGDQGRAVLDFPSASDAVEAIAATRSGELLAAGAGYPADFATGDGFLAKLTRHGQPATGFGAGGLVRESFGLEYSALNALAIQPDGRVVTAGWNFSEGDRLPESDVALTRYLHDGTRDRSFGRGGLVLADIQGAPVCELFEH